MDEKRKEEILMDIVQTDVENASEILDGISEPDDKKCLIEFYKRIIAGSTSTMGFRIVADSIIRQIEDKKWARDIYELAASKAKGSDDFINVAYSYVSYLDDKKRAKELSEKALEIAKKSHDYIRVANFQIDVFEDKSGIRELYEKAETLMDNSLDDYLELGMVYLSELEDMDKGVMLITKAIDKAVEVWEFVEICDYLDRLTVEDEDCNNAKDDLLDELNTRILKEASSVEDYLSIAEYDPILSDSIMEQEEEDASDVDDYLRLLEYHKEMGEESKAQEMYQQALELADQDDPDEMDSIEKAIQ